MWCLYSEDASVDGCSEPLGGQAKDLIFLCSKCTSCLERHGGISSYTR